MKLTHVLGRTWAIEGWALSGLYRLDDNRCILIDSGLLAEREELAQLLRDEGLTPVGALATHVHIDHSINHGWLNRTYGCRTAAPIGEAFLARTPLSLKGYLYFVTPADLKRELGEMVFQPDELIPPEDGLFSFCGADFRIIHTPGHSPDHVSIITPDGVCCTGDAVFSGEMLDAKFPFMHWTAGALDSIRRLAELDCPAYIVSHRGVYEDIAPFAQATYDLIANGVETVRTLVTRPMTWEQVWNAVNQRLSLLSSHVNHAARTELTLRSYLDYLTDTGALDRFAHMGLIYLAPPGQRL